MKNTNGSNTIKPPSNPRRGWIVLLVLLLAAILSVGSVFPWRVTQADAPEDQFSGERAMSHLPAIASQPHSQGTPAQAAVRDYLVEQLTDMGLDVEIQQAHGIENVIARLPGTDPTGTIIILAHYDSVTRSPGAGDNGSGVAVLLEVMRALKNGSAPLNNVVALFDDGEELPDAFTGSRTFAQESPWMADARVAISLDTAVAGLISIDEAGPDNGWIMDTLARSCNGCVWTSISGGGNYDSTPFRNAGLLVLAVESNYPFWQKHTPQDLPDIVDPASMQQMGDQILAIARDLGDQDLTETRGEQETFFTIPLLGFFHYPENLAIFLAVLAGILLAVALVLAFQNHQISIKGLGIALGTILAITALSAIGIGSLWPHFPQLFGWETNLWPDWPEVIPPYAGWIDLVLAIFILGLVMVGYLIARRWSSKADFSLVGLIPFLVTALVTAFAIPRAAYLFTWPVLISSLGWIIGLVAKRKGINWSLDLSLTLAATTMIVFILPFLPGVVMADGMKSLAILAGIEVLILGVIIPAVDMLLVHPVAMNNKVK